MTVLFPNSNVTNTAGNGAGEPGATPNGSQMQGNPQASQFQPNGTLPPNAQCVRDGASGDSTKTCTQQISEGRIPLNIQPGNVGSPGATCVDGTRSLLSMLSTGQVVLNASSYGIGNTLPLAGGQPPVGNSPAAPSVSGINGINGSPAANTVAYLGN